MAQNVEWIVLLSVLIIGLTEALDCISCEWSVKNATSMTAPCLEAPYKEDSITCASSESSGSVRQVCSTKVKFKWENGQMSLESLERNCGSKHMNCNNECAENTKTCWLCCEDTDRCNGFPVRTSIITATSGGGHISPRRIGPATATIFVVVCLNALNELLRNQRS